MAVVLYFWLGIIFLIQQQLPFEIYCVCFCSMSNDVIDGFNKIRWFRTFTIAIGHWTSRWMIPKRMSVMLFDGVVTAPLPIRIRRDYR
jgi:hypothetical protein